MPIHDEAPLAPISRATGRGRTTEGGSVHGSTAVTARSFSERDRSAGRDREGARHRRAAGRTGPRGTPTRVSVSWPSRFASAPNASTRRRPFSRVMPQAPGRQAGTGRPAEQEAVQAAGPFEDSRKWCGIRARPLADKRSSESLDREEAGRGHAPVSTSRKRAETTQSQSP